MAVKVGTITAPASGGAQTQPITNVGFQPKFVMVLSAGLTAPFIVAPQVGNTVYIKGLVGTL